MTEIGCYVERALDRLTVTTMLLCSDSAPKILAGRPASAGLPFLLRCAVLRCVMSCDVPNRVAMWISVDDTPRVWITHILRHRCRFGLNPCAVSFFNRRYERCNFFITGPSGPIAVIRSRDARVTCSPKIRSQPAARVRQPTRSQQTVRRETVSPQRFYTPQNAMDARTSARWAGPAVAGGFMGSPLESSSTRMKPVEAQPEPAPRNVVVVGSAVAGVGASTLAALLARELTERGCKSVLVDADLNGGGLDVLLGVEDEDGSRFGDISAPLGKVDGKALLRELPVWDGVPLLACNPWRSENPQSWEVQACIRALAQVKDAVIVDAGQWRGLDDVPELAQATHITVVEMTVLGLARAKVAMKSRGTAERQKHGHIVGVEPRGVARGRGVTTLEETENYLGHSLAAVVKPDAKLCGELLDGLGLRRPNRQTVKALAALTDELQESLEGKRVKHGTRTP